MNAQGRRSRVRTPALCLACVALLGGGARRATAATRADDAMAFVRVTGNLRAEFVGAWRRPVVREDVEVATGSGFVIAPSGLILTSHHVVDDAPTVGAFGGREAEITLESRRVEVALGGAQRGVFEAYVVASDPGLDLAVLQVAAAGLPYLPFGDSDAAEPGRPVRVLGFPFGRQVEVGRSPGAPVAPGVTVTQGSLSAARTDDLGATRYLQTDASVNPGSSGGPMIDEDGYAVGVVRMKLAPDATSPGAGFGVPINLVKDFLEEHGILGQLPVERLRRGVVHTFDWKGLALELPDGYQDTSLRRLVVDTGEVAEGVSLRLERLVTPWSLDELEEALLGGQAWPGFAPGPAVKARQPGQGKGVVLGSATGEGPDGSAFRLEYGLVDLGAEKIVVRYVGPPDTLAFNLSLVRRSLETLEARPLLTDEVDGRLSAAFEPVGYPGGAAGGVLLPSEWTREPASQALCSRAPVAQVGVAASPPGDFTVVLRALRWTERAVRPAEVARACDPLAGDDDPSYGGRFGRLGVPMGVWGTFVERPGEVLLLEVEAPETKLEFVRDVYLEWLESVAE